MDKKSRPGVMIYFDIRPAVERLSAEQQGNLLMAILNYAERGEIPDLDPLTGLCFDMFRPRIDNDEARYEKTVRKRQYAVYVREAKKRGIEPLHREDWEAVADCPEYLILPDDD